MLFKKLELVGFKSFAEKTTLHFEPGITAVVGPNGCGKSNIFDSIRWVLGEQSFKELRASQGLDVIFNGSDSKEPLGMAEVTLAFDNKNKFFAFNADEVAITRRIFRSGESEYLLNKQQVRLKDINDLLLGTGIGAESYSLVQQGKIDLVLSSRPEDRRLVFDEASGITKYKSQKKEALRRLEETEQNLLRVNDIIIEVKRQIGSLERQANKARRYKEVFEELKNKEINLAVFQKNNLLKTRDEIIKNLQDLETKESCLLSAIREEESKISIQQAQIKELEEAIITSRNQIFTLESTISRNAERVKFNQERILEIEEREKYLTVQTDQVGLRLIQDEDKLNKMKEEYSKIEKNVEEKTSLLNEKNILLDNIQSQIKLSLDSITNSKKEILELASKIANLRNIVAENTSKQQISLARKKRLDIEKAKIIEEEFATSETLKKANLEITQLESDFLALNQNLEGVKKQLESENVSLETINSDIQNLENNALVLASHKEFLEKLKNEYEGIGESMTASIYLDRLPAEKTSGLVIKLREYSQNQEEGLPDSFHFKLSGEAKPIDLETNKISEKIEELQHKIDSLKVIKRFKESNIEGFKKDVLGAEGSLRQAELNLADKKTNQKAVLEQLNKIKAEEEIIAFELGDVENDLSALGVKSVTLSNELVNFEHIQINSEELISKEQNNITANNHLKEETLVLITQTKTEAEALIKRKTSDIATLQLLDETYNQDKEIMLSLENEKRDSRVKLDNLLLEIKELEAKTAQDTEEIKNQNQNLENKEAEFKKYTESTSSVILAIENRKKELDSLKNSLYELQMSNKDVEYKYASLKERILQGYKLDLDIVAEFVEIADEKTISEEIQKLKEKLESYGSVNLVAIEEYDELKKRYDFLSQQQNDLNTAKESLHSAILKINRTTKVMFLETFEKVKVEFKNYFRLLFNGGDAQLFLSDEQDPLESGIEIICRPPGKKLQNILLLSGGEKSMSAIALIFAIFKIKPAPFCVLDEIDAALDEANVDRFSKMLHDFASISQFIVITHNKKTIANADIMYGITMQESGVSRIVSVKFAQNKKEDKIEDVRESTPVDDPSKIEAPLPQTEPEPV